MLDYELPATWLCRPDKAADDICFEPIPTVEVLADGGTRDVGRVFADDPPFDCFYVYPTLDVRLRPAVHEDFRDTLPLYQEVVRAQFARFAEVCRPFAPLYRQVSAGTYASDDPDVGRCFDVAYADVERAFDHYLSAFAGDRGVVLVGHSQGAQIVSRLLRERFDSDEALRARLIGALVIGWPVGVADGELTGGSSDTVPMYTSGDEHGCLVAFRSYGEGNPFPSAAPRFAEGDEQVCVHPADPAGGGPAPLSGAYIRIDGTLGDPPAGIDPEAVRFVLYRDFYTSQCRQEGAVSALAVRASPEDDDERVDIVPLDRPLFSGESGTHLIDMHLFTGDLIARAARMAEGWAAGSTTSEIRRAP